MKQAYLFPETSILELKLSVFIAASNTPNAAINDLEIEDELPWTY